MRDPDRALFAVFDGHGREGDLCAQFCRDLLVEKLGQHLKGKETEKDIRAGYGLCIYLLIYILFVYLFCWLTYLFFIHFILFYSFIYFYLFSFFYLYLSINLFYFPLIFHQYIQAHPWFSRAQ
jgi:hypothetical protein